MTLRDLVLALWSLATMPTVPTRLPPVRLAGVATTYWPGDGASGSHLGCVAAMRRLRGHHRHDGEWPVIATRNGPRCGTWVVVEHARTGRRTLAVKGDTGPWGCRWPDGSRTVVGPGACWEHGGRRIVDVDLSLFVARAIGSDGRDRIVLRWW